MADGGTEVGCIAGRDPVAPPPLRVGFVLLQDFTLTPFAGFIDVLRLATDDGDRSHQKRCHWTVMSADGGDVAASCGTVARVNSTFRDPRDFDYIVLVGGLLRNSARTDEYTDAYLRAAAAKGVPLVGLCTAVFTLIRLGLMVGRRCCVSWFHYWDLVSAFPEITPVADRLFVVDGPRITCAGGTAAVDLAAWIVRRHLGDAIADKCLHILLADHARPADAPQPHVVADRRPADPRLREAVALIEESLAHLASIEALGRRLGLSRRQLERLFKAEMGTTPAAYILGRRVRQGHWMLMRTDLSVTEIAHACGFADASHFSRHVRHAFGASPQAVRISARQAERTAADGPPLHAAASG